jgi:predicted tellurium resistance membrane protein TerC
MLQNLGFYLMFSAFLMAAMERHLETRGRNEPEIENNRLATACFAGVIGVMLIYPIFLAGGAEMARVFGTLLGVAALGLLALAANTIIGGFNWFPEAPRKILAWLERHEEFLRKYVFPMTYATALLGLAYQAGVTLL